MSYEMLIVFQRCRGWGSSRSVDQCSPKEGSEMMGMPSIYSILHYSPSHMRTLNMLSVTEKLNLRFCLTEIATVAIEYGTRQYGSR